VAIPSGAPLVAPSNVPAYQTYGYSAWQPGSGEDYGRRFDLMPTGYPGAANTARLLSFFSMSDIHITDKESTAQGLAYGWLAGFGSDMSSSYSPVILSTTHVLDAAIRAVNALHNQTPFDCGIFLGDAINNTQFNELRWYLDVIDGKLMIVACHVPINPQTDLFNTNSDPQLYTPLSCCSDTQLIATLQGYPNLIMLLAGHRHKNTVTPHPSPDPAPPENGFWAVEVASLRDFPQEFRTFDIRRNSDHTISILTTDVDPQVAEGTPAGDSRGYAVGAMRICGGTNTFADTTSHAYNAELVKPLTPAMQAKLAHYGTHLFTHTIAVMSAYITNQMTERGITGLSIALVERGGLSVARCHPDPGRF